MLNTVKQKSISARVEVNEYVNKVLAVVKAKYGLKDKSEAINKFVEMYGEEIVEKEAKEEYVKELIKGVKEHIEKYGYKSMNDQELDSLFNVNV
ncbi:MAG: antitoxin [Nanoarchaeota archaeon]